MLATAVDTLQLAGAIVLWVAGVMGAVAIVVQRTTSLREHVRKRVARTVREFVSPIIREELTATNGGSTVYDRLSNVEIIARDTSHAVADLPDQFDRIRADIAMVAELSRERAATAEHRADRIEGRLDAIFRPPVP